MGFSFQPLSADSFLYNNCGPYSSSFLRNYLMSFLGLFDGNVLPLLPVIGHEHFEAVEQTDAVLTNHLNSAVSQVKVWSVGRRNESTELTADGPLS